MQLHQMYRTSSRGNEEVYECPVCHRVVIIQWNPYSLIIIEDGDAEQHQDCIEEESNENNYCWK